jgi:single stranded DNA-binding protein
MGASLNKVQLIGRMGKDPEIRYTASGQAVANFSIATDESYTKDGEKVKKTEWHNVVVWGKAVENFVQPYLHKGDLVYIDGKLQTRSWEDKDGNKKYTTEINVTDIKGLVTGDGGKEQSAIIDRTTIVDRTTTNRPRTNQRPAPASAHVNEVDNDPVNDEDVPF